MGANKSLVYPLIVLITFAVVMLGTREIYTELMGSELSPNQILFDQVVTSEEDIQPILLEKLMQDKELGKMILDHALRDGHFNNGFINILKQYRIGNGVPHGVINMQEIEDTIVFFPSDTTLEEALYLCQVYVLSNNKFEQAFNECIQVAEVDDQYSAEIAYRY